MENEDSLKIERLEDDGLQDVSGGAGDYVSHYQYWKQVIPGIRAECRY